MPTFQINKKNAIEIRVHALIAILAIALVIFDTNIRLYLGDWRQSNAVLKFPLRKFSQTPPSPIID